MGTISVGSLSYSYACSFSVAWHKCRVNEHNVEIERLLILLWSSPRHSSHTRRKKICTHQSKINKKKTMIVHTLTIHLYRIQKSSTALFIPSGSFCVKLDLSNTFENSSHSSSDGIKKTPMRTIAKKWIFQSRLPSRNTFANFLLSSSLPRFLSIFRVLRRFDFEPTHWLWWEFVIVVYFRLTPLLFFLLFYYCFSPFSHCFRMWFQQTRSLVGYNLFGSQ